MKNKTNFYSIRTENVTNTNHSYLLQDETANTILIDFGSASDLKNSHNLECKYSNQRRYHCTSTYEF